MRKVQMSAKARAQLTQLVKKEVARHVNGDQQVQQVQAEMDPVFAFLKGGATVPNVQDETGYGFAGMVRCAALAKGNPHSAMQFAKQMYGEQSKVHQGFQKALGAGDLTAGGFLVPEQFSNEVIELLRPLSVVRAMEPRTVRLPRGNLSIPKITGSATAQYTGENTDILVSEPTTGEVVLSAKKLTCLVVMSNELLKFSNNLAEQEIRQLVLEEMAKVEDLNLLRGEGTADGPLGILNRINAANVLSSNGTSATNVEDDFKDLINAIDTADVRMVRPVWVMNPAQKNHLRNLRDPNGNLIFPEIRESEPKIYGWPVLTSTQVPTNEVFLIEPSQVMLGEVSGLEVETTGDASYVENGTTLASAFSRDQTLIRVITHHDISMRHDVAAAVINDVAWG